MVLEKYSYPGYRYVGYNEKLEFFKDKRVRWAMSHAVPVDQIIDKVYHDLAERLTGPFLPGSSELRQQLGTGVVRPGQGARSCWTKPAGKIPTATACATRRSTASGCRLSSI